MGVKSNPLREFEPHLTAMDLEWIDTSNSEGFEVRSFRITTARFPDGPVRTYGMVAFPHGSGPSPGILHIHGGCQSAAAGNAVAAARRGYVGMSFDWSGPEFIQDLSIVTEYPPSIDIRKAPLAVAEGGDITSSRTFLAVRAARCCLALLASLGEVDADRIGLYGVSWGGFLAWVVNGIDPRVKCAVPIFGTGGMHESTFWNVEWAAASEDARRAWMHCLEPRGYAFTQVSPVCHINGANDFFGRVDVAGELLPSSGQDYRCDLTPGCNHAFDRTATHLMDAWFDRHLSGGPPVPAAPPIRAERVDATALRVTTRGPAEHLTLWYSFGRGERTNRCWRAQTNWQAAGEDGELTVTLAASGDAWLFVREYHPAGDLTICSMPLCVKMPLARATPQDVLYDGARGADGWGYYMTIEPANARAFEEFASAGEDGMTILAGDERRLPAMLFFGMSDPDCRPHPDVTALAVDVSGAEELSLTLSTDISTGYTCTLAPCDDGTHLLRAEDFKNGENTLADLGHAEYLILGGTAAPDRQVRISRITWKR